MNKKPFIMRLFIAVAAILLITELFVPDLASAKGGSFGGRGGGFGGRGGSFGGRSGSFGRSTPRMAPRSGSSFGGSRQTSLFGSRSSTMPRSTLGGMRLNNSQDYTRKYGIPRQTVTSAQTPGLPANYSVHNYSGYGNGLMMGYLLGQSSWMWAMPFHPAYYYSRPYYTENLDGSVEVYPPTFQWSRLIFTIIIFGVIIYIIFIVIRNKRRYGGGRTLSQSSFS